MFSYFMKDNSNFNTLKQHSLYYFPFNIQCKIVWLVLKHYIDKGKLLEWDKMIILQELNTFSWIYVSPPPPNKKMGRHIVFSSVVCLSVRHTFVSALYLLNPWWDLQITLHKCQVWWVDVQCLCLTKVGSRSRSQSKIKHCMTVFRVIFEPLVKFTKKNAQMSSMIRRCAVLLFDQGRFKVKVTV